MLGPRGRYQMGIRDKDTSDTVLAFRKAWKPSQAHIHQIIPGSESSTGENKVDSSLINLLLKYLLRVHYVIFCGR